jgi:hypothetical protein
MMQVWTKNQNREKARQVQREEKRAPKKDERPKECRATRSLEYLMMA